MAVVSAGARLQQEAEQRLKSLVADGTVTGFSVIDAAGRATLEVRVSVQTNPTASNFERRDYDRLRERLMKALGGLQWRLAARNGPPRPPRGG